MRSMIVVAVLAVLVPLRGAETKLGEGVTLKEPTAIAALVARPGDYSGKTIRIDGVATAVCTAMGCWMAVASESAPNGPVVRLKVEDGVIVFPVTAKGKKVSAQGVFEAMSDADEHAKEAAGEHAKQDAKASAAYQIKATGALIH